MRGKKTQAPTINTLANRLVDQNRGGENNYSGGRYESQFIVSKIAEYGAIRHTRDTNSEIWIMTHQAFTYVDDVLIEITKDDGDVFLHHQLKGGKKVNWYSRSRKGDLGVLDCIRLDQSSRRSAGQYAQFLLVVRPEASILLRSTQPTDPDVFVIEFENIFNTAELLKTEPEFALNLSKFSRFRPESFYSLAALANRIRGIWDDTSRKGILLDNILANNELKNQIYSLKSTNIVDGVFLETLKELGIETYCEGGFLHYSVDDDELVGAIRHPIESPEFGLLVENVLFKKPNLFDLLAIFARFSEY